MNYKVVPVGIKERIGFNLGLIPVPVVDMIVPAVKVRAIECGVNLGIFDDIKSSKMTLMELAIDLNLNQEALEYLLRVLVSSGYLKKIRGYYKLTRVSKQLLMSNGKCSYGNYVRMSHIQRHTLEHLEQTIQTGIGSQVYYKRNGVNKNDEILTRGLLDISRLGATVVSEYLPVKKGSKRFLDIGGGHGLAGAMTARRYPGMKSTVLDSLGVIKAGQKIATEEGYKDVVTYKVGNVLTDDIGNGWDIIFAGHLFHHFTSIQIREVCQKSLHALTPDGTFAIWEAFASPPNAKPDIFIDSFSLFFRVTSTAGCYSREEYQDFLKQTGFRDVKVYTSIRTPTSGLVTGRK